MMIDLAQEIDPADQVIIERAFEQNANGLKESMTIDDFKRAILHRIYTEVCCDRGQGRTIRSPIPYANNALQKWIEDETHYVLEGSNVDDARFTEVHAEIVTAVVKRAIELFTAWNGRYAPDTKGETPKPHERLNLRASLIRHLPIRLQRVKTFA